MGGSLRHRWDPVAQLASSREMMRLGGEIVVVPGTKIVKSGN